MSKVAWPSVLAHAAVIAGSYDTPVTLRQLFYRLVADGTLENSRGHYNTLSHVSAAARDRGEFPALMDQGRDIDRRLAFDSPEDGRSYLRQVYRRDRTEGQETSLYLGVEKAGIVAQLRAWYGSLGLPILALHGYSSQTFYEAVRRDVEDGARPAALLYAGDFDPSGEDILRHFEEKADCFDEVVRVALTEEQVREHDLPEAMGKHGDSRAAGFVARHGRLVQVELDALPPDTLRSLYQAAIDDRWDESAHESVLAREAEERATL